ncbi:hypothetical protein IG631_20374 [Alternaria alternata]|nr:hypothetical protein IG631_20374 [Alternaria alternata]
MQASAPVPGGNSTRFGQGGLAPFVSSILSTPQTIARCLHLSRTNPKAQLPPVAIGHYSVRRVFRTPNRLITTLAYVEGPLTRRLICPHRPSVPLGTGRTELKTRDWPQILTLPSLPPPADCASSFGL